MIRIIYKTILLEYISLRKVYKVDAILSSIVKEPRFSQPALHSIFLITNHTLFLVFFFVKTHEVGAYLLER